MHESPDSVENLADHAHRRRVVVVGGGIAGLVAALECAKVGLSVTVLEASEHLGGTIGEARLDGLAVGTAATGYAVGGGAVRALIDELGLGGEVVAPAMSQTWIADGDRAAPLPAETVRGIPANPWAEDVRRLIGWSGAWRAYVDRLRPPLTIGAERNLARLVGSRMGARVLDRMVAPLTVGTYGVEPGTIDVEVAAPGLSTALTRTGSLGGAVADLRVDASGTPGIAGVRGGMTRLVTALAERLGALEVDLRVDARVIRLAPAGGAGWHVHAVEAAGEQSAPLAADAVIVATDERSARSLLEPVAPALAAVETPGPVELEAVTLLVECPALDAHPRGDTVHRVPGTGAAASLVHETARWPWLAAAAGPGRHVVRVVYGSADVPPVIAAMSDDEAVRTAADEASALLGVPRSALSVVSGVRTRHLLARPASSLGLAADTAAVRSALGGRDGLGAVGAWLAGGGIAATVADAVPEADRIRRAVLWGPPAAP